jgi:flagellar basal body-associated protein FliL
MDAVSFTCKDTPISIPVGFNLTLILQNGAPLRLVSSLAGTGKVTPLAGGEGLSVDETTMAELRINRSEGSKNQLRNALIDARLVFPAAHGLPGVAAVAELFLYFKDGLDWGKWYCLCISCVVGTDADPTASYFTSLTPQGNASNRPLVSTLFAPTDRFLEYKGADLRGRTSANPLPRDRCDPVALYVTYYVCTTPISMGSQSTVDRLKGMVSPGKDPTGPYRPTNSTSQSDLLQKVSRIEGIGLGDLPSSSTKSKTKATSAMKCYRIDPAKDVVNGQVKLNQPSKSSLYDELVKKEATDGAQSGTAAIQPGDIEFWIAFAITLLFILVGAGVGVWYAFFRRPTPSSAANAGQANAGQANAGQANESPTNTVSTTASLSSSSLLTIGFAAGFAVVCAIALLIKSLSDKNGSSMVLILLLIVAIITPGITFLGWFLAKPAQLGTSPPGNEEGRAPVAATVATAATPAFVATAATPASVAAPAPAPAQIRGDEW